MKINEKIISIPPYISTTWKNVTSLHVESRHSILFLVVSFTNGMRIAIPNLDRAVIKTVFDAHLNFMEEMHAARPIARRPSLQEQILTFGIPLPDLAGSLEDIAPVLKHNPEQADAENLPKELLEKIALLSQMLGIKDSSLIPHSEPDCNCMHCQIANALKNGFVQDATSEINEEIVTDEELKFRTWDILKNSDTLYTVTNPLDAQEQYCVHLGDPVGCTCGTSHCEHVRAVLSS